LVERFFGLITDKQIRRGVFTSVKELESAIHEFIESHNANSKPFVWTKSASDILAKVGRAREALLSQ
jgi:phage-related protein